MVNPCMLWPPREAWSNLGTPAQSPDCTLTHHPFLPVVAALLPERGRYGLGIGAPQATFTG